MRVCWPLAALGVLFSVGQPSRAQDAEPSATVRIRTPGFTARATVELPSGREVELGETMLLREPVELPVGRSRICLDRPELQRLCKAFELDASEHVDWEVWPSSFPGWEVTVRLPRRAVTVRVFDETEGVGPQRDAGRQQGVPPGHDSWLIMTDAEGWRCLCHVPPLRPGSEYTCTWECSEGSSSR